MPSKSPAQHRMMEAVAHDPAVAKKLGIPQSVGRDFAAADQARALHAKAKGAEDGHAAHTSRLHAQGKTHGAKHGA